MDHQNHRLLKETFIQFLKFNIVGISNVLITYGIYSLAVFLTDSHRGGLIADYLFGIVYTYLCNKVFTFKKTGSGRWKMEFLRIIAVYVVIFVLNWLFLNYLVEARGWNKYFAQVVALASLTVVSFYGQKYLVFRDRRKNRS